MSKVCCNKQDGDFKTWEEMKRVNEIEKTGLTSAIKSEQNIKDIQNIPLKLNYSFGYKKLKKITVERPEGENDQLTRQQEKFILKSLLIAQQTQQSVARLIYQLETNQIEQIKADHKKKQSMKRKGSRGRKSPIVPKFSDNESTSETITLKK